MKPSDVSIVTITWARDAEEERVLRVALAALAELRIPTFVADGGSGEAFVEFLGDFEHFRVLEPGEPGVWPQTRRGLRAAVDSGARFVLYTEPDKGEFFRDTMLDFVSEAPGDDGVGVVLASRSEASFETFPEFQRSTESAINRCCAEVLGAPFDYMYGPFLLNRNLVPRLDIAGAVVGWGWRPLAFGVARRLGYRIVSLVRDLPCPSEQSEDDPHERLHRMRQLGENVRGLLLSVSVEPEPDRS